jgi:hypothetical protein
MDAFPGMRFILVKEESPGFAEARSLMPLFLRVWLAVFSHRVRYPHWHGIYEGRGHAVEFYLEADEPVQRVRTTSYGMTSGLNSNLDRLCAATGWTVL